MAFFPSGQNSAPSGQNSALSGQHIQRKWECSEGKLTTFLTAKLNSEGHGFGARTKFGVTTLYNKPPITHRRDAGPKTAHGKGSDCCSRKAFVRSKKSLHSPIWQNRRKQAILWRGWTYLMHFANVSRKYHLI